MSGGRAAGRRAVPVPVRAAPVQGSGSPARRPGKGGERRCGAGAPGWREPARDAWVEGVARLPGGSWAL